MLTGSEDFDLNAGATGDFINANTGAPISAPIGIVGAMAAAFASFGARVDAADRYRPERFERRIDSAIASLSDDARRDAAFDLGDGYHTARELEHVHARVLDEVFTIPSAMMLFPIDTSVPVGATSHTTKRVGKRGKATIYRRGQPVKLVSVNQKEYTYPIRHVVDGWGMDLFSMLSSRFAGSQVYAQGMRAAREVIVDTLNEIFWFGNEPSQLRGILDNPFLAKLTLATVFDRAYSATANAAAMLAALNRAASYPHDKSRGIGRPDRMVVSPRLRSILFETLLPDTGKSVGKAFLENHATIKSIDEAAELQEAGPGGADGIFVWRASTDAIGLVLPQSFTTIPAQKQGFEEIVYGYASTGGVVMHNAYHNALTWVQVNE